MKLRGISRLKSIWKELQSMIRSSWGECSSHCTKILIQVNIKISLWKWKHICFFLFLCFVCENVQWLFFNICIWTWLLFTNEQKKGEQKIERQSLMALRNRILSLDYSIKSPADTFPARADNGTSHYKIANVSPVYSLMISSSLTSQKEQNIQLPLLRFPSKIRPISQDFLAGFHEIYKQYTTFFLHNKVYFSNKWKLIH